MTIIVDSSADGCPSEAGPGAGERALMRAVLEDAFRCLMGDVGPAGERAQLALDARAWIDNRDTRWPFSFESICESLGLDAGRLRARLPRTPEPTIEAVPGERQNVPRQRRPVPAEDEIVRMIRAGHPLRVVAQTFGISISKASILSCGLASRIKAERDEEIRRLRDCGSTHRALAAQFGLSRIRIMRICSRRLDLESERRSAA
jgi:hypothetical protein